MSRITTGGSFSTPAVWSTLNPVHTTIIYDLPVPKNGQEWTINVFTARFSINDATNDFLIQRASLTVRVNNIDYPVPLPSDPTAPTGNPVIGNNVNNANQLNASVLNYSGGFTVEWRDQLQVVLVGDFFRPPGPSLTAPLASVFSLTGEQRRL